MSGHSHSSNIQFRKGRQDAKRGKIFTKYGKLITVAVRQAGPEADGNPALRLALEKARRANMPKDTIERAIKRGSGDLTDEAKLESLSYEGYGVGGAAILVDVTTDNRNRSAGDIRKMFERGGGQLGTTGCVSYLFEKRGVFLIGKTGIEEDRLLEIILEAGGDDLSATEEGFEVLTTPQKYDAVTKALAAARVEVQQSEIMSICANRVQLPLEQERQVWRLVEELEDHDDVIHVYHNCDFSDALRAEMDK